MVAYHFPPVGGLGAAGSQRALKFARFLPDNEWTATVLTVRENSYKSYLSFDRTLSKALPPELSVIRTGVIGLLQPLLDLMAALRGRFRRRRRPAAVERPAGNGFSSTREAVRAPRQMKDALTDLFSIPDDTAGWFLPATFAGVRAIRRNDIDAILATGLPWTSLVIGAALKALTGRRLIVDFRDPWMTNPFRLDYSVLRTRLESRLEAWVLKKADLVVVNTEHLREEFVDRFGARLAGRCVTVLNGFEPDEMGRIEPAERDPDLRDSFLLTHTGFLYGKREPRPLLEAIRLLHERGSIHSGRFVCQLIGPTELPYDLDACVEEAGLTHYVRQTGQVSRDRSLAMLAAADAALLLQPGTRTQIPSKLFEYIGLGKRTLAVAPPDSAVAQLVTDNDLGEVADPADVEEIAAVILKPYREWLENKAVSGIPQAVRERFDVRHSIRKLSGEMHDLFETRDGP